MSNYAYSPPSRTPSRNPRTPRQPHTPQLTPSTPSLPLSLPPLLSAPPPPPPPPPIPKITLRHINADATFLITYHPPHDPTARPFTVLLDPWLVGTSPVFHPKFSVQAHTVTPSITHLHQLEHFPPDVVVISQDRSDHCHEETLRQLSFLPRGGRNMVTKIFAVKGAASKIRRWGILEGEGRVVEIRAWSNKAGGGFSSEPSSKKKKGSLGSWWRTGARRKEENNAIPAPGPMDIPKSPSPPRDDYLPYNHNHTPPLPPPPPGTGTIVIPLPLTTPNTPLPSSWTLTTTSARLELTHLPAPNMWEIPGLHTALALRFITEHRFERPADRDDRYTVRSGSEHTHLTIFTPHGVSSAAVLPYLRALVPSKPDDINVDVPEQQPNNSNENTTATSTAARKRSMDREMAHIDILLHPFTLTTTPPHLGGKITLGTPNLVDMLVHEGVRARCVVSAHDEVKNIGGYVRRKIVFRRWEAREVKGLVNRFFGRKHGKGSLRSAGSGESDATATGRYRGKLSSESECDAQPHDIRTSPPGSPHGSDRSAGARSRRGRRNPRGSGPRSSEESEMRTKVWALANGEERNVVF